MQENNGKGTLETGTMEEQYNERITRLETEQKNIFHQLDEIKESIKDLTKLTTAVETMAERMKNIFEQTQKIEQRLGAIEQEPKDDFKHYKRAIISCIISGVIGAIISGLLVLLVNSPR